MVLHDPVHNKGKHSIHNHFIIKALHLTRPGGLVAVLTSRYTLDSLDESARREMHSLADLVTAIRLPCGAHLRTAGTRVVMDVLIFRRREIGDVPPAARWLTSSRRSIDGQQVPVSDWFWDEPKRVLGKITAVHGAYRAGDLSVEQDGDWLAGLRDLLADTAATTRLRWTPNSQPAPVTRAYCDCGGQPGHHTAECAITKASPKSKPRRALEPEPAPRT